MAAPPAQLAPGRDPFAAPISLAEDRRPPLPHNLDAEEAVIGGCIIRNDIFRDIHLAADDFFDPRHQAVWRAMAAIDSEGEPIDEVTIAATLQAERRLERAGGRAYLDQLGLRVPTADNAKHYAGIVADLATRRRLMEGASRLVEMARHADIDALQAEIARLDVGRVNGKANGKAHPAVVRAPLRFAHDFISDIVIESKLPKISTGFPRIDQRLGGGMAVHTMTLVTGPEGSGKTAIGLQISASHAEKGPALYYCGELTGAQLVARIIAQRVGVPWQHVRDLRLTTEEMHEVLDELDLRIITRHPKPIEAMRAGAEELVALNRGPVFLAIDYLQLCADVADNQRGSTAAAVRAVLAMTEELPIVTLGFAQGSRNSARAMRAGDGETSDYAGAAAETSEFERSASNSIVLLGTRPDDSTEWEITAAITKARFGVPGRVGLRLNGATGGLAELDQTPISQSEAERAEDIIEQLQAHANAVADKGECPCGATLVTKNALSKKGGTHKVPGTKTKIARLVAALEKGGRVRNEGGALTLVAK